MSATVNAFYTQFSVFKTSNVRRIFNSNPVEIDIN